MDLTFAMAGNPNCGKTTIFNHFTGAKQHVGNYPGITVEKTEGHCRYGNDDITVVDLPGIYGLNGYSLDETVARNYIVEQKPDAIVGILDSTNLERNFYFMLQLIEFERPLVLGLNMMDEAVGKGLKIDVEALSRKLDLEVIPTVGRNKQGVTELLRAAVETAKHKNISCFRIDYGSAIEEHIYMLEELIARHLRGVPYPRRWLALKLLDNDREIIQYLQSIAGGVEVLTAAGHCRAKLAETLQTAPEVYIARRRFDMAMEIYRDTVFSKAQQDTLHLSEKLDSVLLHSVWGLPILLGIMWLMFQLVFTLGNIPQEWINDGFSVLKNWLGGVFAPGILRDVIVDAVIGGVGGVLVFLPNILMMFLAIAVLEGTGYMARAAFIMDRLMRSFGLHGKSFVTFLMGFGCSVPAIMSARTLESPKYRLLTVLVTPFMSCSARLPVYTLLIGAFFAPSTAGTIMFSLYLLGIVLGMLTAKVMSLAMAEDEPDLFVLEMPPYRLPAVKNVLLQMWERSSLYLKKAATFILAASIIVSAASTYPELNHFSQDYDGLKAQAVQEFNVSEQSVALQIALQEKIDGYDNAQTAEKLEFSYAGRLGKALEPVVAPLGFDWKIGASLFTGFAAKEVVISTMGTIFSVGAVGDDNTDGLAAALTAQYTPATAIALMVFVLLYTPCMATIAIIKRETNSWKWPLFSIVYASVLAWVMAFIAYRVASVLGMGI